MHMPIGWLDQHNKRKAARRRLAEQQVRAKFPMLIEGSSSWYRAVANRERRLRL